MGGALAVSYVVVAECPFALAINRSAATSSSKPPF